MKKRKQPSINYESLRWLRNAVVLFLRSPGGHYAKLWIGCLVVLILVINGLNVANSFVLQHLMSSIEVRNQGNFMFQAWMYAGVFVLSTIAAVFYRYSEERLGLLWRDWMTKRLTERYIDGRIYLNLKSQHSLTNPDQRISEDVKALTLTTLSFVLMILNSAITVLSFSGVLWTISPALFLVSIVYAFVGSGIIVFLGRPLNRLNYRQSDFEANFRGDLVLVGQAADGIALSGYERRIRSRLMRRVDRIVLNQLHIIKLNRNLGFFSNGYNYMIQLIPIVIVAPIFIREGKDFGIIGQSVMAFSTLVASLSLIVTQFQSIFTYGSVLIRLGEFSEAATRTPHSDTPHIDCSPSHHHFRFHSVRLTSPGDPGRTLIDSLDVTFPQGTRALIHGGDHTAQQAIFRAAAGLPVFGSGSIECPAPGKAVFLPENPFLPPGTLRDVLVLSDHDGTPSDREIQEVVREVGLGHVLDRGNGIEFSGNWHDLLSLKDEQLMAICRAILSRPQFAILDHLNSSLGNATEKRVLALLSQRGITCISISDELPDPEFHDASLKLNEDLSWEWTDLKKSGEDA